MGIWTVYRKGNGIMMWVIYRPGVTIYGQEFLFWTLFIVWNHCRFFFFNTGVSGELLNAIFGFCVYFVLNFRPGIESGTMT